MDDMYRNITKIYRNMQIAKSKTTDILNETTREALRFISKHQNVKNSDLVSYLGVNKALVTRICQKLEEMDYISSTIGNDRRIKLLNITAKGKSYKLDNQSFEANYYRNLFADEDSTKLNIFLEVLERAYKKSKFLRKEDESK